MTMERVGLEACSLAAWLHQGLSEGGIPPFASRIRQAKAAMGAMPNKTTATTRAVSRRSCALDGIALCM